MCWLNYFTRLLLHFLETWTWMALNIVWTVLALKKGRTIQYCNHQDVNRLGNQPLLWVLGWRCPSGLSYWYSCFAIIYTNDRWLDGDKQTYIMLQHITMIKEFMADAFSKKEKTINEKVRPNLCMHIWKDNKWGASKLMYAYLCKSIRVVIECVKCEIL